MVVYGFALLVFGYALAYAGMTGFLGMLSGGKIPKVSVMTALGITGPNGLSSSLSSYGLKVNPFVNAAALNVNAADVTQNLGITAQMAPAAYSLGNGQRANSPISSTQALGGGSAAV
jgi:hypothetical protein